MLCDATGERKRHGACRVRRVRSVPRERRRSSGCPTTVRRPSAASRVDVPAGPQDRARWCGATGDPSSCCCTAARRTRTRGTRSRWRSTARSSRSTYRVTATPTGRERPAFGPRENAAATSRSPSASSRPTRRRVVGMSLGGLTTIALAGAAPELVRSVVLVDVTPGRRRREVEADRRLHQRARELPQLRRAAGAHDRVQPDPHRVVAAPRDPPQRGRSATTVRGCGATRRRSGGGDRRRRRPRRHHRELRFACGTRSPRSRCR